MKNTLQTATTLVMMLLLLGSCEEEPDCQINSEAPLRAGFYGIMNDTLELDTTAISLSIIGIGAIDTLSSGANVNAIALTLNPFVDSSAFLLNWGNGYDTLIFRYRRELQLISEKCGFLTTFEINEVNATYNFIDSIALVESTITPENVQHLKIYF